ncbi:hypothetical protein BHE74_00055784, partial [Ensete ventricosum]
SRSRYLPVDSFSAKPHPVDLCFLDKNRALDPSPSSSSAAPTLPCRTVAFPVAAAADPLAPAGVLILERHRSSRRIVAVPSLTLEPGETDNESLQLLLPPTFLLLSATPSFFPSSAAPWFGAFILLSAVGSALLGCLFDSNPQRIAFAPAAQAAAGRESGSLKVSYCVCFTIFDAGRAGSGSTGLLNPAFQIKEQDTGSTISLPSCN